jgi:hypothetical protein
VGISGKAFRKVSLRTVGGRLSVFDRPFRKSAAVFWKSPKFNLAFVAGIYTLNPSEESVMKTEAEKLLVRDVRHGIRCQWGEKIQCRGAQANQEVRRSGLVSGEEVEKAFRSPF